MLTLNTIFIFLNAILNIPKQPMEMFYKKALLSNIYNIYIESPVLKSIFNKAVDLGL